MTEATTWYLALLLVGGAGLLPAALLFGRAYSGGVLYARPVGTAVVTLAAWLLGWSDPIPYGLGAVLAATAALVAWSATIAWRRRDLLARVARRWRLLLAGEVVLLVVFALVVLARAQAPDAVHTEKPMDLMLLVAIERAEQLPPPDPWLAGEQVSYYHLGHTSLDVLRRLSGNSTGVAFNLGVATAGALAAAAALGLIVDVLGLAGAPRRRALVVGGVTGLGLLLLVSPVVGLVNLLAANGVGGEGTWGRLGVEGVPVAEGATRLVPDAFWWWWSATRILPDTITEFPAFTLLLGDPHAHLLALPLALLVLALAVATFEGGTPLTWRRWLAAPEVLALTGIVFAGLVMTNAWDLVTLGPVWGLAAIAAARRTGWPWPGAFVVAVRWALAPAAVATLLALPFLAGLDRPPLAVAPVVHEQSDPLRWLLVWFPLLAPAALALWLLSRAAPRRAYATSAAVAAVALVAWAIAAAWSEGVGAFSARTSGWVVLAALVTLLAYVGAQATAADARRERAQATALALLGVALAVLLALELVRIDDAFPGRLNTVFKYGFQAWAILAVAAGALSGLAAERIATIEWRHRRVALGAASAVAIALVLLSLYTPAMGVSRGREGQEARLDAIAFLAEREPALAAAVEWSRDHLDPSEHVLVQAIGESYTDGNRVATHSGVPTLLAWPNHERQWRGEIAEGARRAAVEAIYAGSPDEAEAAIRRWGATHVLVGADERAAYGDPGARFEGWAVAFEHDAVRILEAPR